MDAIALLSSGIDSPVAAYIALENKWNITAVHLEPKKYLRDDKVVEEIVEKLESVTGQQIELMSLDTSRFHESVGEKCASKLHCILCKRFMYKIASHTARERGCEHIITGESIGQVASQTLENLKIIEEASDYPVLRPLIALDKVQTIDKAKEIGTYEISVNNTVQCPFVPKTPSTKSELTEVKRQESLIDYVKIIGETVGKPTN